MVRQALADDANEEGNQKKEDPDDPGSREEVGPASDAADHRERPQEQSLSSCELAADRYFLVFLSAITLKVTRRRQMRVDFLVPRVTIEGTWKSIIA